jgi:hypothetical protein
LEFWNSNELRPRVRTLLRRLPVRIGHPDRLAHKRCERRRLLIIRIGLTRYAGVL